MQNLPTIRTFLPSRGALYDAFFKVLSEQAPKFKNETDAMLICKEADRLTNELEDEIYIFLLTKLSIRHKVTVGHVEE